MARENVGRGRQDIKGSQDIKGRQDIDGGIEAGNASQSSASVGCSVSDDLVLARRNFLKAGALGFASAFAASDFALAETQQAAAATASTSFPVVDIAPLSDIAVGGEIQFDYPDENSPGILLRLDSPAEGGIGPNESIVAFSMLCTHKGCPVQFRQDKQMLICPCHFSSFDAAKGGRVIIGQAVETLPQIKLRIEDGKVQAIGVAGLIFGRHTNIL